MFGAIILPPLPLPFTDIRTSVPVAMNWNQTSWVAVVGQQVGMDVNPVVAPTFVKFKFVEQKLLTFGKYVAERQSSPCP
jgi:hypothetical protein